LLRVFYLIYVSNASRALDEIHLQDVLTVSREANAKAEVTGLLLYKDGCFMQMLEGDENVVKEVFERIMRDPRHYNVVTLQEGVNEARVFPDWSMGYRRLDGGTEDVAVYGDFENTFLTVEEFRDDPPRCLRLLRLFREHA
jgi:hypothetical protein